MARRSARTTDGSISEGRADPAPSHSLINIPLAEEAVVAPAMALEGRLRQMEERQTEMLTLVRNLGAPRAPVQPPVLNNPPPPAPNHALNEEAAREEDVSEELSDAASSTHPARPAREPEANDHHQRQERAGPGPVIGRTTREEICDMIAEEYGQAGRRIAFAHRPVYHGSVGNISLNVPLI